MDLPFAVWGLSEFCPFRGRLLRPPDSANVKQVCLYTVLEMWDFFYYSSSMWNQFWGVPEKKMIWSISVALNLPKLISREMWMAEKFLKFYIVFTMSHFVIAKKVQLIAISTHKTFWNFTLAINFLTKFPSSQSLTKSLSYHSVKLLSITILQLRIKFIFYTVNPRLFVNIIVIRRISFYLC